MNTVHGRINLFLLILLHLQFFTCITINRGNTILSDREAHEVFLFTGGLAAMTLFFNATMV